MYLVTRSMVKYPLSDAVAGPYGAKLFVGYSRCMNGVWHVAQSMLVRSAGEAFASCNT